MLGNRNAIGHLKNGKNSIPSVYRVGGFHRYSDHRKSCYRSNHARKVGGATCAGGRVWSLYVPNGRGLEDPHMPYKLEWLRVLKDHAKQWVDEDSTAQVALVGDWNVAPQDEDVWDMQFFLDNGLTHVSAPERASR